MHNILIAAGGTGGHVIPGLAVAEIFLQRNVTVNWVGTEAGIESSLVPHANIPLYTVPVRALRGRSYISKITSLIYLFYSIINSFVALFRLRPSLVLGMGGYVSGPCGFAAWVLRIPVVIHEQNSVPGLTNKLLAKISNKVLLGYREAFKGTADKMVFTGNPVRQSMLSMDAPEKRFKGRSGRIRLLVMGGSQGAVAINEVLPKTVHSIDGGNLFEIVHQTGKNSLSEVISAYENADIKADVFSFTENIADHFQWADIVIARSGALTVAEIMAVGLASILIPYPFAVDDHQTSNAQPLVEAGAAILVEEKNLSESVLSEILHKLDRDKAISMALIAHRLARPAAANDVVDTCLNIIDGEH